MKNYFNPMPLVPTQGVFHTIKKIAIAIIFLLCISLQSLAYSVLTHEALIDASWNNSIVPLLKKKFPAVTEQQLKDARAYAYGGAVAPDMGYYPFGNKLFTNLVHYVRSGDMVMALLDEAKDVNGYAFALGFLCHYTADNYGHPIGVNRSVPLEYPKLKEKFGNEITYAEDKKSHLRTEFSFDVLQVARGTYANEDYHDFIGFKVDTATLAKAFFKTYGLSLDEVFHHHLAVSVETFRWAVKEIIPFATKAAWASKSEQIKKVQPTATSKSFRYKMRRLEFNKEYGTEYKHPGLSAVMLSFIIRFVPKVGPLAALKFKVPSEQVEKNYIESFETVMTHYSEELKQLHTKKISLTDKDFDTGNSTSPGEYPLADDAYADLVLKLKDDHFQNVNTELRQNIQKFFSKPNATKTKKENKRWTKVKEALDELSVNKS